MFTATFGHIVMTTSLKFTQTDVEMNVNELR